MPTRNVNLTDHYDQFITDGIEAGHFSNASEAVRAGLRLLEQNEQEDQTKIDWLRGITQNAFAAFDRGEGVVLNSTEDIDALIEGALETARAIRIETHA